MLYGRADESLELYVFIRMISECTAKLVMKRQRKQVYGIRWRGVTAAAHVNAHDALLRAEKCSTQESLQERETQQTRAQQRGSERSL